MVKTARILCRVAAALSVCWGSTALAQRVQFATPAESSAAAPGVGTAGATPSPTTITVAPSTPSVYPTPTTPTLSPAPATTFAQPGTTLGATPGAPGTIYTPSPGAAVGPAGAVPGAASAPASTWDPFATPGATSPTLLQQDPCLPASSVTMGSVQKFIQHVNFDYAWFSGGGDKGLGINDLNLDVTFAFPLFNNTQTPLLVTPGFGVHYWEGPISIRPLDPADPAPADMPPRTYDGYLDFAWNPQIADYFGAELNFRMGIYSDFYRVTSDAFRFTGKGLAVVKLSPNMTLKGGIWYLDRVRIKMLPAGGLVWTPSPDFYANILFPNPEIGKKLTTWGNTEWWGYVSGEYGGGTWMIRRETGFEPPVPTDGTYTQVDYNDIEIALGLRFKTIKQFEGYVEVGLSCSRELVYADHSPEAYYPSNTVFVGAGLTY